jgi:hypothetical protein
MQRERRRDCKRARLEAIKAFPRSRHISVRRERRRGGALRLIDMNEEREHSRELIENPVDDDDSFDSGDREKECGEHWAAEIRQPAAEVLH